MSVSYKSDRMFRFYLFWDGKQSIYCESSSEVSIGDKSDVNAFCAVGQSDSLKDRFDFYQSWEVASASVIEIAKAIEQKKTFCFAFELKASD